MAKAEVQSFTQNWDKTIAWARSQNIPFQSYYPIYQMDVHRVLTGQYQMSEADRINAIQAAHTGQASTAIPHGSPINIIGNTIKNAEDIFTGLSPFGAGGGLIGNIISTVKNTIEHPQYLEKAAGDLLTLNIKDLDKIILSPHNLLSWVPGMADFAQLTSGHWRDMVENPLSSILDVMPMGKFFPAALARTEQGAALAGRLGVTTDELAKMDVMTLQSRLLKRLPMRIGDKDLTKFQILQKDAHGLPLRVRPLRVGERINLWRNQKGMGRDQGELLKGIMIKGKEGTDRVIEKLGPIMDSIKSLSDDEKASLGRALQTDTRPHAQKMADSQYTPATKDALQTIHEYLQQDLNVKLKAGQAIIINTQFGPEVYSLRPGSNGITVQRAKDAAEAAQTRLDQAAKVFDVLAFRSSQMDRQMDNMTFYMEDQAANLYATIRNTEPGLAGIAHAIGEGEQNILWEKIVETQSPIIHKLLGMREPGATAAIRRTLPAKVGYVRGLRKLAVTDAKNLHDLFAPGALIDSMVKAFNDEDWVAFAKYSRAAKKKFDLGTFRDIPAGGPMSKLKDVTNRLNDYGMQRERLQNEMDKLWYGTKHGTSLGAKHVKSSILNLSKEAMKAHSGFIQAATDHPPDFWSNIKNDKMVDQILSNEHSAKIVKEDAVHYLSQHGMAESTLDKIRQDPRTLVELFIRASKDSYGNGMMPDIDVALYKSLEKNAYDEIAALRAMGHRPEYIPMISPFDVERQMREGMNIYIGSIRPKSISSTFNRAFEFNSSIFNVAAGLLKDTKEQIAADAVREYFNEYVQPLLQPVKETNQVVTAYLGEEIAHHALKHIESGVHDEPVDAIVRRQLDRMGLITYDPNSLFGEGFSVPKLDAPHYIDKHLADAIQQGVRKFQFPAEEVYDKATGLFRDSILKFSPRYTAHILVGGTALVAYRGTPGMFRQLGAAAHMFRHGDLPPDILERHPYAREHIVSTAAQEGRADNIFHAAAGYTMGNHVIREWLDNHGMPHDMPNWLKAAANINYTFTRAVVNAQRAVVYLDGAEKALKRGYFYELVPKARFNPDGTPALHEITQKPIYDRVQQKVEMTPERAHHEGMMKAHDVMGDLRAMTPFERQVLTRAFPFYGWQKHVLTYVFTYPVDHPFRTVFLSQLADQNSKDMASGLPTRLQLLTTLGHPDEFGNVTGIDTRAFNPLRDVANYATIGGLIQSLNPVISAPFAYVDPEIVFGSNELYPTLHYSQLYGVKTAGPQGNLMNVAEAFVPQLTAADAAFNLSGHYAYLKSQGGGAFAKKIYQSLNVPFFQLQHVNLKTIAAQQELDRFQTAKAAALQAAQTGDMSALAGYDPNAPIPDPLNPLYTVTPAYIAAMNQASERKYKLPMAVTMPSPPNPPL